MREGHERRTYVTTLCFFCVIDSCSVALQALFQPYELSIFFVDCTSDVLVVVMRVFGEHSLSYGLHVFVWDRFVHGDVEPIFWRVCADCWCAVDLP